VFKLLLIALVVLVVSQILLRFIRSIQFSVSNAVENKTIHVRTPIGTLDVKPKQELHPILQEIPKYPSATQVTSDPAEYEAEVHVLSREFQIFVATYWTSSPADAVWEFYRNALPGWQETRKRGQGRILVQDRSEGTVTVRVYSNRNTDTHIEFRLLTGTLSNAATASSGRSSDSRPGGR